MNPSVAWLSKAVSSCFFLTYVPAHFCHKQSTLTGAGLIGTLAVLFCVPFLPSEPLACLLVVLGALAFSIGLSDYAEEAMGRKDDPRIVIDEWIGYLCSVALLPRTWLVLITAFVLFRIFDVWKPLGIRRLSHLPGGWGVVMDDVAAGLLVNGLLHCALWLTRL